MRELDGSDLPFSAVPILPGGEHPLPGGRFVVRPFPTVHPVPSQGYCVFSRRSKLKPEFAGLQAPAPAPARPPATHALRSCGCE